MARPKERKIYLLIIGGKWRPLITYLRKVLIVSLGVEIISNMNERDIRRV